MVFLDRLKQQFFSESSDILNVLGISSLKHKLESLKKEERDAAAHLGYEVLARGDAAKYGGEEILIIQEKIAVLQKRLAEEEKQLKSEL